MQASASLTDSTYYGILLFNLSAVSGGMIMDGSTWDEDEAVSALKRRLLTWFLVAWGFGLP
jgi:hypothetical protein